MRTGAGTVRIVVVAAVSVMAATIGAVVGALPAAAETVQLVLDCQAGAEVVQYTLPFASRASAWVSEGGTATMSIDPVVQTLPAVAPPPLPQVPIDHYENVVLELSVTGGTITNAAVTAPGEGFAGTATLTTTAASVTITLPGPVPAGAPFTTPAFTVELSATAPAGGEIQLVPAAAFYLATAVGESPGQTQDVSCFPQDPALATTTIPVIAPSSPPAPPLPPPPPPSPPEPPAEPSPPVVGVGELVPLAPQRLLDTRDGTGAPAGPVAAGSSITVAARGAAGIPADASAVILNVTATEPEGDGFVTVYPCGGAVPVVSNVNYRTGDNVPNLVTVPLAADGTVCLFTLAAAHLLADVSGAVVPAGDVYTGTSPVRLVDTRDSTGFPGVGPLEVGQQLVVPVAGMAGAPGDATAAVVNLTVTEAAGPGFLSAFPCLQSPPNASNVNFVAGQTVSNLAFTSLGPSGALCIAVSAPTHVVVDLAGWTAPSGGATLAQVAPTRVVDTRTDGTRLAAGATLEVDTADLGAPSTTTALVANVTAVDPAGPGYLSVYPCGQAPPNSSNVNYAGGETRPVLVFAALGANGRVCITSFAAADVLVDLQGWFVTL